jgi:LPS-assembly lipoprotein
MRKLAMIAGLVLSIMALGLTGCGFTPVHAPNNISMSDAAPLQNMALIMEDGRDANDKEVGFHMQQRLKDRLSSNSGQYTLTITPRWTRGRLGISADDVASRYDGNARAEYVLTETKSGKVLDKGRVTATSTFAASDDSYGLITANDNAMQNTAREAADRIIFKLAAHFAAEQG